VGFLEGKVALVTGAGQGIGRAIAQRLAAEGATVAVNDLRDDERVRAVVAETGGFAAIADVSRPDAVAAMVTAIEQRAGGLDIVVSNAAAMTMGPFLEQDAADWWRPVDVCLSGSVYVIGSALPALRRRGGGRIVVVASEWGVTGWPLASGYAAAKAGLIPLVKGLGRELAPEGIIVNGIAPGVTDTPQLEVDAAAAGLELDAMRAEYAAETPRGRIAAPEEMAATVAFLVNPAVGSMIGQVLQPNGGTVRCQA
jgi:NAD(P)-dependent dehydrogenase (short-subunit alcohol dehydrogenase family)